MKAAAAEIVKLESTQIEQILEGKSISITVEGAAVTLDSENVIVDRIEKEDLKVINDGTLTVGLDTKITDELSKEGYARDLIRGIQNLRKESGFEVTDKINLTVSGDEALKGAFDMFKDYIAGETLSASINWADSIDNATGIDADNLHWQASVVKA